MAGWGGSCSAAWTGRHRRAWSAEWQSPGSLSLPGSRAAPWLSGGVSNFSLCLFSAPQLHSQLLVARTGFEALLFLQTPGPGLVTMWGMNQGQTSALSVTALEALLLLQTPGPGLVTMWGTSQKGRLGASD